MSAQPNHEQGIRLIPREPIAREIDAFLIDRQARGLSAGTVGFYRKKLHLWCHLFTSLDVHRVEEVSPQHLRQCLLELSETHNPGGVHALFRAIRTFRRWREDETEPAEWNNPLKKVRAPKAPTGVLEPLPLRDLKKMLATCDRSFNGQRDRAVMLCLLDSGARASEFTALNICDVNLTTGAVTIGRVKWGQAPCRVPGRQVTAGAAALSSTEEGHGRGAALVDGRRQPVDLLGPAPDSAPPGRESGRPVPALHSFRRANALLTLRGGADLLSVSRLLGHADLSTTRRYLKLETDDLREAHRRAGPVDRLL
jgi:integrase/recombinase XerD